MRSTLGDKAGDLILSVTRDGRVQFYHWLENGQNHNCRETDVSVIPLNKWVHVAAAWDGASGKLYINGKDAPFHMRSLSAGWGSGFEIGRHWTGGNSYNWRGKIDNVMLYRRALSEAEINQLMELRPSE